MSSAETADAVPQTELAAAEHKTSSSPSKKSLRSLFHPTKSTLGAEKTKSQATANEGMAGDESATRASLDGAKSASGASAPEPTTESTSDDRVEQIVPEVAALEDSEKKLPENLPRLTKPIVVPRLQRGSTPPLARAWAPEAVPHGIEQSDFLALVDNLNLASRAPPAASVLQMAALGISVIPWDGAEGIAALVELSAIAVAYGLVAHRCRTFLDQINASYFHPRQLHARLVTTKRMKQVLGVADDDPLIGPLTEDAVGMTAHQRCLSYLTAYACELSHEIPEPEARPPLLDRFAAWKVRHDVERFDKAARRARKRAWKRHLKGKRTKREGFREKSRIKHLQWLLVQDLGEFQREEAERARRKEEKQAKRGFSWKSWTSASSNGAKLDKV